MLQDPRSFTYYPIDPDANLADVPLFRTTSAGGPVSVAVFPRTGETGVTADGITVNLHKLGNTTHSYAAINMITGTDTTANTWLALTPSATYTTWGADETLALTVVFLDAANVNFGATQGTVCYQVDYLDAGYPREFK